MFNSKKKKRLRRASECLSTQDVITEKTVRLAKPLKMCEEINDVTSVSGFALTTVLISDTETESDEETEQIYFENSQASIIDEMQSSLSHNLES